MLECVSFNSHGHWIQGAVDRRLAAHNCDNENGQVSVVKLETTTQSRLSFCRHTIKYSSLVRAVYMSDVLCPTMCPPSPNILCAIG